MNKPVPLINLIVYLFISVVFCSASADARSGTQIHSMEKCVVGDSIVVQKSNVSRKHRIQLYPDASQRSLFFSVKGKSGRVYQLFLFDVEGHLVKQANIRDRETTILPAIERGDYTFEVFSDDERIENGQVYVY